MELKELYHPESGRMRVAGFISGSGTNLRKIIEHQTEFENQGWSPYTVALIFSENPSSNAREIGDKYGIPVILRDLKNFCKERGKKRKDLSIRMEFDKETAEILRHKEIDTIAYAGYMSIATEPLLDAFLGVNVHPADLTIVEGDVRKYTGDNAVRDAILAGEKQLRATTHIVESRVDYGRILMVSNPLTVELPEDLDMNDPEQIKKASSEHQNRLKEIGDWIIFPKTLEYIADGRFSKDENGNLYFDGEPIPHGIRMEEVR